MVIVSLAFIGIIVAALLSAAGYALKLKLQEKNAKNNFYYVEQAMQEIYSGVGTHTVEELKSAYSYTIENMVRFDTKLGTYVTITDEEANKMFKQRFLTNIKNSDYFKSGTDKLAESLESFISNDTVKLDSDKLSLVKNENEIIIKDVTLTRTEEYSDSAASGTYTQTISADIIISEPDFEVQFNNISADYSAIFDYAMVADMGIDIEQTASLSIIGNLYAASDYYNKTYDEGLDTSNFDSDGASTITSGEVKASSLKYKDGKLTGEYSVDGETVTVSYKLSSITNKQIKNQLGIDDASTDTGYVNDYVKDETGSPAAFDGINENSRYSGLYINNTSVSILTDKVIVPGTFAVMNDSTLVLYGKAGSDTPQVWADDIILGGSSKKETNSAGDTTYSGSEATFRANLFVKDDTELNAAGSSISLRGSYYGYGDSTSRDSRVFTGRVDKYYFMLPSYDADGNIVKDADGSIVYGFNRGHYNSSSIVVNGENASLDFSQTNELYIAGRAYIELSKYNTTSEDDDKGTLTQVYQYIPSDTEKTNFVEDYKTGESIAYKTSQLIYIVSNFGQMVNVSTQVTGEKITYSAVEIPELLDGVGEDNASVGFGDFFPTAIFDGYLPVTMETVKNRDYLLIDFETAYSMIQQAAASASVSAQRTRAAQVLEDYPSLDEYVSAYAVFYATESAKGSDSIYYPELSNISANTDFEYGDIDLDTKADDDGNITGFDGTVYSSGAITVRVNDKFTMTTANNSTVINDLLSDEDYISYKSNVDDEASVENMVAEAFNLSNDLEMEYNYLKWNLDHYDTNDVEKSYVSDMVSSLGEDSITPINKYMLFGNLSKKKLDGYELNSGNGSLTYRLWAGEDDVTITGAENITGIVITKGDVTFADDVKSFNGMIISGGKIYIHGNLNTISSDPATCREILRQCLVANTEETKFFLSLFKEYASVEDGGDVENSDSEGNTGSTTAVGVDTISYTDVVSMENWMKNVGGAYDAN